MALNGNRYSCAICSFTTNTTSSIRMHNLKCHSAFFSKKSSKVISRPKLPARVNASLRLSTPSKVFARRKASTSAKKSLQCQDCAYKTNSKKMLSQHSLIHIEEKYSCTNCAATFYSTLELNAHVNNAHLTVDAAVKCDICLQEFPRVNSMIYHRRSHMQSQSFTCPVCQKIFYDVIAFRNHQGLHKENNSKKQ